MRLPDGRSGRLAGQGISFYAAILTAMRRADPDNLERLKRAFPESWDELCRRYNSPNGLLASERDFENFEAPRR